MCGGVNHCFLSSMCLPIIRGRQRIDHAYIGYRGIVKGDIVLHTSQGLIAIKPEVFI